MIRAFALAAALLSAGRASAQDYDGYFSALFSAMPDVDAAAGRQTVGELRTRLFAEGILNPREDLHVRAGLFVDALAADRGALGDEGFSGAAVVHPADIYVEYRGGAFELRAGMARIVWGRLDELQPTDVVNPIDLSRFVFEGRSEARLPVGVARARVFLPRGSTLEAVVVPFFRGSRFDQLDEETSPFRIAPAGPVDRREPAATLGNVQGGGRFTSTVARLDWGVSAWRGFETFPVYTLQPAGLAARFPRFTMIGVDFETVRGPWGFRGEAAWFDGVTPRSFEAGVGADRRAGNYRVAINAVVSRADETDVTLVGWAERSFARETRTARLLAVYDPTDDTAFVRAIVAINLRDNFWLEGSGGWITGDPQAAATPSATSTLGLLARRDFLYARWRLHF